MCGVASATLARTQTSYVCRACGGEAVKWQGQCAHCKQWDTLEAISSPRGPRTTTVTATVATATVLTAEAGADSRWQVGLAELDRVFGGGLTPGSVTLLGGEPGIGKSTLLLQVGALVASRQATLYVSGEESVAQVAMRARRLRVAGDALSIVSEQSLDAVLALAAERSPSLLIIDSIQSMTSGEGDATPGTPTQLRECAGALVRFAKSRRCAVIIVGHVTKDGSIAGPKLLEHLVDTVLYFESDAGSRYRMLRATKNRFGPVNELGFFAMSEAGLKEVRNPAAIFLSRRSEPAPGSVVMVARDGNRPLLIEVQGLVNRSGFGAPRRVAQGVDANRVSMLLAILSRHADLPLNEYDVFVNLVGGIDIPEPATDLPIALALASSLKSAALSDSLAVFGELGLTGEVRPVAYGDERLREAIKLGFKTIMLPRENLPKTSPEGVTLLPVSNIAESLGRAWR